MVERRPGIEDVGYAISVDLLECRAWQDAALQLPHIVAGMEQDQIASGNTGDEVVVAMLRAGAVLDRVDAFRYATAPGGVVEPGEFEGDAVHKDVAGVVERNEGALSVGRIIFPDEADGRHVAKMRARGQ